MSDETPARSWNEIAAEIETEKDPERIIQLADELSRALADPEHLEP